MKNLKGEIINNRLITGRSDQKSGGHWKWNYECMDCKTTGTIREIWARKNFCQCVMSGEKPKRVKKMKGEIYGKWTVTDKYEIKSDAHAHWWCICDCGNEDFVSRPNLISGGSTNCGCVNMIDWNGMRFHSRWEIYVAMAMDELGIKYGREIDRIPVIHPYSSSLNQLYYVPDFTIFNEDGAFSHWVEVKGTHPRVVDGEWKAIQILEKLHQSIIIREEELDEILGCKYRNIDRIYSKGNFPAVQTKITKVMSNPEHAEKTREILLLI
jgi:hypothetical protein